MKWNEIAMQCKILLYFRILMSKCAYIAHTLSRWFLIWASIVNCHPRNVHSHISNALNSQICPFLSSIFLPTVWSKIYDNEPLIQIQQIFTEIGIKNQQKKNTPEFGLSHHKATSSFVSALISYIEIFNSIWGRHIILTVTVIDLKFYFIAFSTLFAVQFSNNTNNNNIHQKCAAARLGNVNQSPKWD